MRAFDVLHDVVFSVLFKMPRDELFRLRNPLNGFKETSDSLLVSQEQKGERSSLSLERSAHESLAESMRPLRLPVYRKYLTTCLSSSPARHHLQLRQHALQAYITSPAVPPCLSEIEHILTRLGRNMWSPQKQTQMTLLHLAFLMSRLGL